MSESTLTLSDPEVVLQLFGPQDQNLRLLRSELGVTITHRSGQVRIAGQAESVRLATEVLERLKERVYRSGKLTQDDVAETLSKVAGVENRLAAQHEVAIGNPVRRIKPRTEGQARYIEVIRNHDLTFCIGPAGCGKTYLAVASAVEALKSRAVRKIVLVRPAVEAGESLGYLPGICRQN